MKFFIEDKLATVMADYDAFRLKLAQSGEQGDNISDALREEVIWEKKIRELKKILKDKKFVLPEKQNESIQVGSACLVFDEKSGERRIILDGAGYSNKDVNIISCYSPIGKALLDKKAGDKIVAKDSTEIIIREVYFPW